jgi:hypothetical protein
MARVFFAFSLLAILVLSGSAYLRQEMPQKLPDNPLERQVPYTNADLLTTRNAFHAALGPARVLGGIVTVIGCEQEPRTQMFRGMGQSVRDIMDQLVSMDPKFRWEMDDGVIDVLPAAGEPPLLRVQIPAFEVIDITSPGAGQGKIEQMPEVRKAMADLGLGWGLSVFSTLLSPHPKKFSVQFKGGSVREALNAIARAEGSSIWDYAESHCNGKGEVLISF